MTAIDVPLSRPDSAPEEAEGTTHISQCTLCEAHCGIHVTVTDGRVSRIAGNPDDVFSKGHICPKATAMGALHHDPDRLRTPMRRVGDSFEPVSWDAAFAEIGSRLRAVRRRHGVRALGMYLGNPAAHSSGAMYGLALRLALLTPNFFSASSIDQMPHEYAAWRVFGSNALVPITDIDRTHRLVIVGANPAVSNGSLSIMPGAKRRIKAVRDRGGKVVVIDPRRTETAKLADQHVAVKPGGDVHLLLGMLHVLINEDLCDSAAITGWASGFEQLRQLVAEATPEVVAEDAPDAAEEQPAVEAETPEAVADEAGEEVTDQTDAAAAEEAPAAAEAPAAEEAPAVEADKLTTVNGIGPKYSEILANAGITTFATLAETTVERLQEIITEAGSTTAGNEETWPTQAGFLAKGDTEGFDAYVESLKA